MANQAIINAAKAAYTPVQGENNNLSGFIQGITAVAAGIVKQKEIRKKMQSDLDKFYSWAAYKDENEGTVDKTELKDYLNEGWVYRALRLHIFLKAHTAHSGIFSTNLALSCLNGLERITSEISFLKI